MYNYLKEHKLRIFVWIIVLLFCSTTSSFAQNNLLPVNYLMKEAKDSYAQESYSQCAFLLSQVLYSNPNFKPAQDLLTKLLESQQLTASEKADIVNFQDLVLFNDNLILKINYYLQKRNEVIKYLETKGFTKEFINDQLTPMQIQLVQLRNDIESKISDYYKNNSYGLVSLVYLTNLKKSGLTVELKNIQDQFNHLKSLNRDSLANHSIVEFISPNEEAKNFSVSKDINLNNEVLALQEDVKNLQKLLQEKDDKVSQLTQDLKRLTNEVNSFDHKNLPSDQKNVLKEDYDDLQSRFQLSQKIIQSKDEEIQKLKSSSENIGQTQKLTKEINQQMDKSDDFVEKQLIEVSGMLEIYKSKLSDVNKTLKANIAHTAELEEKLAVVQTKLFEKDQIIQSTEQNMEKLEQKLLELQDELDSLRQSKVNTSTFTQKDKISLQNQLSNIHEFLEVEWKDFQHNASPLSNNIRELDQILDQK